MARKKIVENVETKIEQIPESPVSLIKEMYDLIKTKLEVHFKNQHFLMKHIERNYAGVMHVEYPADEMYKLATERNFYEERKEIFDGVLRAAHEGQTSLRITEKNLASNYKDYGGAKEIIEEYKKYGYTFFPHEYVYSEYSDRVTGINGTLYWMPIDTLKHSYWWGQESIKTKEFFDQPFIKRN